MKRLLVFCLIAGVSGAQAAPAAQDAPAAQEAPNVLFLSVDTLRADFLGCYGHRFDTTPFLDRLAEQSLLFEDVLTEIPLTGPAFGSMLSSLYPRMTGMSRNGLPMPDHVPLVQEVFQAAGYQTMCAQSNWTLKAHLSRLDRGFDIYDDEFREKRWGLIKPERGGEDVTDTALKLLGSRDTSKPFFLWAHYSDPHAPYAYHRALNRTGKQLWRLTQEKRVRVRYDTEVAFTDQQIERLFEAIPDNTVVLFVADHGESLYEHDYLGHGRRIYQTIMQVPLMIRAPSVKPGRTSLPTATLDVGPTLLGLAGLEIPEGMLGHDLLNDPPQADRIRYLETYGGAVPQLPGARMLMGNAAPMRSGVVHDGWKLITGGNEYELYNIEDDSEELNNLAQEEPNLVSEFKFLLDVWQKAHPKRQTEVIPLSSEDRKALQSLGYLD